MSRMFLGATSFNQYLDNWDISKVFEMSEMFDGTALSTNNYDYILYNWSLLNVQPDVSFGVGTTQYSAEGAAARQHLIDEFGWIITDGGQL